MLDKYCDTLADAALLEIALRLTELALPIWEKYFSENANGEAELMRLFREAQRVAGSHGQITKDFPRRALFTLNEAYAAVRETGKLEALRKNPDLTAFLCTSMQPLTHPGWDDALPRAVRLVFTATWNILTWLVYRQYSDSGEVHIYVAINQAADALLSEKTKSVDEINAILLEYQDRKRDQSPHLYGSKGDRNTNTDLNLLLRQEAFERIIGGKKMAGGNPTAEQKRVVMRQMKEEGKIYWDEMYEYQHGTNRSWAFNKEKNCFMMTDIDVIVGSFCNEYPLTEAQMMEALDDATVADLREFGFKI